MILSFLIVASCAWTNPGVDRYTGDPAEAVQAYTDIPQAVRDRLAARVGTSQYDRQIEITPQVPVVISDMFFGQSSICHEVTRSATTEYGRGLVYCDSGHCVLFPVKCGNVARIENEATGNTTSWVEGESEVVGNTTEHPFAFSETKTESSILLTTPIPNDSFDDGYNDGNYLSVGGTTSFSSVPGTCVCCTRLAPVMPVPEPSTWALFAAGLALIGAWNARRK